MNYCYQNWFEKQDYSHFLLKFSSYANGTSCGRLLNDEPTFAKVKSGEILKQVLLTLTNVDDFFCSLEDDLDIIDGQSLHEGASNQDVSSINELEKIHKLVLKFSRKCKIEIEPFWPIYKMVLSDDPAFLFSALKDVIYNIPKALERRSSIYFTTDNMKKYGLESIDLISRCDWKFYLDLYFPNNKNKLCSYVLPEVLMLSEMIAHMGEMTVTMQTIGNHFMKGRRMEMRNKWVMRLRELEARSEVAIQEAKDNELLDIEVNIEEVEDGLTTRLTSQSDYESISCDNIYPDLVSFTEDEECFAEVETICELGINEAKLGKDVGLSEIEVNIEEVGDGTTTRSSSQSDYESIDFISDQFSFTEDGECFAEEKIEHSEETRGFDTSLFIPLLFIWMCFVLGLFAIALGCLPAIIISIVGPVNFELVYINGPPPY